MNRSFDSEVFCRRKVLCLYLCEVKGDGTDPLFVGNTSNPRRGVEAEGIESSRLEWLVLDTLGGSFECNTKLVPGRGQIIFLMLVSSASSNPDLSQRNHTKEERYMQSYVPYLEAGRGGTNSSSGS